MVRVWGVVIVMVWGVDTVVGSAVVAMVIRDMVIRDILGHIATWDREVTKSLRAFLTGTEYIIPDLDDDETDFNQQAVLEQRALSTQQIVVEWKQARVEFKAVTNGKPNNLSLAYHWARMIEILHSIEKIEELLHDDDLQGNDLVVKGKRREEAVGIIEAPRGTLFHHYRINDDDQVTMCNLIVSTTSNNEPMNRAVESVARKYLSGVEITEGLLNHVEVAIRAYDPCLSCATHAMGRMPLHVDIIDAHGKVIASGARSFD